MSETLMKVPYDGLSVETVQKIVEKILKKGGFSYQSFKGAKMWVRNFKNAGVASCVQCTYGEEEVTVDGFVYDYWLEIKMPLIYSFLYKEPVQRARAAVEEIDSQVRHYAFMEQNKGQYNIAIYKMIKIKRFFKDLFKR